MLETSKTDYNRESIYNYYSEYLSYGLVPSTFMAGIFDIQPDSWQQELLNAKPPSSLLLCSRQSGKSTVSASMALYEAIYNPGSLVLIVSRSYRQAEELFRKVKTGLKKTFILDKIVRENQSGLELSTGSRILSLPGNEDTIRSFSSVSLLIIDEAAQVSDELYATVRPMLAISKGRIIALTTPYGKRGWFFNAWESGRDWYKVRITADECPRITKEFLETERNEIGEWWFRQEYFCEFVDTEDQLFTYDMISDAVSADVEAWVA